MTRCWRRGSQSILVPSASVLMSILLGDVVDAVLWVRILMPHNKSIIVRLSFKQPGTNIHQCTCWRWEGWKQGNVQRAVVLGNTEHNLVDILVNESSILLNVVSIASCSLTSVHGNLCWIFKIPNLLKRENWNNGVLKLDLNQLVSYCLAAAGLGWAGLGILRCAQHATSSSQHQPASTRSEYQLYSTF